MTLKDLHQYCAEKAEQHPELYDDIFAFYDLAEMEIEDGSSVKHECELAVSDIDDLLIK